MSGGRESGREPVTNLHACLRGFPGAVVEVAPDGVVVDSNGRLEALLGHAIVGQPFAASLDASSREKWSGLTRDRRGSLSTLWELVLVGRDALELRTFAAVRAEGEGESIWLVEYARDLRLEPRYEELAAATSELARTQRELAKERARLTRLLAERESAVQQRDDVLAIVAHDLRNPIDRIMASASLLLDEQLDRASHTKLLEVIQRTANGMHLLVRDLLDAASIDAGRLSLERATIEVGPLFDAAMEAYQGAAAARGLRIERRLGDVPPLNADRGRVLQVLGNLLANAVRLTASGGRIVLSAQRAGDAVALSVADTGPGIPEADRVHLFERFWQAKQRQRGGAGLGLAIAKGIVEAHGGRISCESTPGVGTTFTFTIPIAPADQS